MDTAVRTGTSWEMLDEILATPPFVALQVPTLWMFVEF